MGFFPRDSRTGSNVPSVFEPLKFYCSTFITDLIFDCRFYHENCEYSLDESIPQGAFLKKKKLLLLGPIYFLWCLERDGITSSFECSSLKAYQYVKLLIVLAVDQITR